MPSPAWPPLVPVRVSAQAMLMSAFPPIDSLDDAKPDYGAMPVDQFEDNVTKFLAVMDHHLQDERKRAKPPLSANSLFTLMKRR